MARIRAEGAAAIAAAGEHVQVDLSGLERGNSVAVALLMAWLRTAQGDDKSLVFTGAPAELTNIIELSGMSDVLPLQESAPAQIAMEGE
jgi:phospholipid transport system transporter-binding protein